MTRDAARWISDVVDRRCPNAIQCMDPFHVVQWATKAVDDVRRDLWRKLRSDDEDEAKVIKGTRWVLLKNRDDLSDTQQKRLSAIQEDNKHLYRAYLLKEQLRLAFTMHAKDGHRHLNRWLIWARRSQVPQFVKVAKTVSNHLKGIKDDITHRLSNSRVEAMNTSIRLIMRKGYGFHSPQPVISLAMLTFGGMCPPLPSASRTDDMTRHMEFVKSSQEGQETR